MQIKDVMTPGAECTRPVEAGDEQLIGKALEGISEPSSPKR